MTADYNLIVASFVNNYGDLKRVWDSMPDEQRHGYKSPDELLRHLLTCRGKEAKEQKRREIEALQKAQQSAKQT